MTGENGGVLPVENDLSCGELAWPALGDGSNPFFVIAGLLQYGLFSTLDIGGSLDRVGKISSDLLSHRYDG